MTRPHPSSNARDPKALLCHAVAANPGIHVRRVGHLLGMSWSTCIHHVRGLVQDRRLVTVDVQGRVCLYPGGKRMSMKRARALLQDPINRRVARLVEQEPGLSQRAIAERLDLATSVVHRRVGALEEADAVLRHPDGRTTLCFPCEGLADLVMPRAAEGLLWNSGMTVDLASTRRVEVVA